MNALIAYMPPPPGQAPQTLLYLERCNLTDQLKQPDLEDAPSDEAAARVAAGHEGVGDDRPADAAGRVLVRVPAVSDGTEALILTPTSY